MDIKEQDRLYMDPPSDDWSGRRVVRRREVRVLRLEEGVWGILQRSPEFGQLAKVGSRPRRRSLECHGSDGVILLS